MTFLGKCLAIFVLMILPLGLFILFGYLIWRRIFKPDAYKFPFGKSGTDDQTHNYDDEYWYDTNGSSTRDQESEDGASWDLDDSGDDDTGSDD